MFPITAGLGALSYLTSLLQSSSAAAGSSQGSDPLSQLTQPLDSDGDQSQPAAASLGSGGSVPPFDSGTLSNLLSAQGQNGSANGQAPANLFSTLDSNGDSQISQSEFESGLSAAGVDTSSADSLFSTFDTNGDGSVSQSELIAARRSYHPFAGLASMQKSGLANGATTQIATNADGSTTTTMTYADGRDISMTTPVPKSSLSTLA